MDRLKITCMIRCNSTDTLRQSEELAKRRIDLDHVIEKIFRQFVDGLEKREHKFYRLGDYFDSIELHGSDSEDPLSFELVFHVQRGVDSFWKDLVATLLRSISDETGGSIGRISQSS